MTILLPNQRKVLSALARERDITDRFVLSGGTALAEFYLQHRRSDDLDFFAEEEFDPQAMSVLLKRLQSDLHISSFVFEQSFNRNLFFLHINNDIIKTEFTYFPFQRIEKGKSMGELRIDSLIDIAVNKVFTIYQKPRARDFIDIYCIFKSETRWTMADLIQKAQIKFDHHLDPIQMSAQLLKAEKTGDLPQMVAKVAPDEWLDFCRGEAKKLARSVIK